MNFKCPNCQRMLGGTSLHRCPHCGADLSKFLTPLETGMMTEFGLTLIAGVTGLLSGIAFATYIENFRSPLMVVLLVLGCSSIAWTRAQSLSPKERFSWEQFWIISFCGSIAASWAVLVGLDWSWALSLAISGMLAGHILCRLARGQWESGRRN